MKTPSEMRLDMNGSMTPVGQSLDQNPNDQQHPLSMALKQRRLAKAQKRRLTDTNSSDDDPSAISNSNPESE